MKTDDEQLNRACWHLVRNHYNPEIDDEPEGFRDGYQIGMYKSRRNAIEVLTELGDIDVYDRAIKHAENHPHKPVPERNDS